MRILLVIVALSATLGLTPALAQLPQPGTTTAGPDRTAPPLSTPAPVPSIAPPLPMGGAPSAVPERIAPPGGVDAGPANSTPFSAAPTGTGDVGIPLTGGSSTPSLSK